MRLFVTGTDTGVGKTYVSAALVKAGRATGLDLVGLKPFCCGDRDDAEALAAAAGNALSLNEVNPVWFRAPAAPYTAAMIENRLPDLTLIRETIATVASQHESVLVEGVGGWLVPVLRDFSMADLARELGWPVLVVAANRLGALNHTLLTAEAIRARALPCAGIVLNDTSTPETDPGQLPATTTNREILETLVDAPVWTLGHGEKVRAEGPWTRLLMAGRK